MRRLLREMLLTGGALAGVLGLALAVATFVFGLTPTVVRSGSMGPAIPTGSLAFTRDARADALAVGDVVTVPGAGGQRVMHRITDIAPGPDAGSRTLTLRGDANAAPDPEASTVSSVPLVVGSIPFAGRAVAWSASLPGLLTIGGAVLLGALLPVDAPGARPRRSRRRAWRRWAAGATAVAVLGAGVGAGLSRARPSHAAWTDQASAAAGALGAHTVLRPANAPVCTNDGGLLGLGLLASARLTWTHRDARYVYPYTITRHSTGAVVGSGVVTPTGAAGTPVVLDIVNSLITGVLLGNVQFEVTIRSALATSSGWVSADGWTTPVHSVNILLLGLTIECGPWP